MLPLKAPAKAVKLSEAFTLGFVLCQMNGDLTNLNYKTRGKLLLFSLSWAFALCEKIIA